MADILQSLSQNDINKLQELVLALSTEGNPLLPLDEWDPDESHQLLTNAKKVIQAINEVKEGSDLSAATVTGFATRFNKIVGSENTAGSMGDKTEYDALVSKFGKTTLIKLLYALSESTPDINLDDHNNDVTAHEPIINKIEEVAGDTHFASNKTEFKYKNLDGTKMLINEYADRQPGAWMNTQAKFQTDIANKLTIGDKTYDGIYYIKEGV